MVDAAFADKETAPIREEVRAAMTLVEELTLRPEDFGPKDVTPLRELGVPDPSIEDVIAVCASFNTINRIADALEFAIPSQASLDRAAPVMYKRGYKFG